MCSTHWTDRATVAPAVAGHVVIDQAEGEEERKVRRIINKRTRPVMAAPTSDIELVVLTVTSSGKEETVDVVAFIILDSSSLSSTTITLL